MFYLSDGPFSSYSIACNFKSFFAEELERRFTECNTKFLVTIPVLTSRVNTMIHTIVSFLITYSVLFCIMYTSVCIYTNLQSNIIDHAVVSTNHTQYYYTSFTLYLLQRSFYSYTIVLPYSLCNCILGAILLVYL